MHHIQLPAGAFDQPAAGSPRLLFYVTQRGTALAGGEGPARCLSGARMFTASLQLACSSAAAPGHYAGPWLPCADGAYALPLREAGVPAGGSSRKPPLSLSASRPGDAGARVRRGSG